GARDASRRRSRMAETKHWDVVVVGGINTDFLVQGPNLPEPGQTVQGRRFLLAPGGKGANQAVAAARLGARVTLVGSVGDDDRGEKLVRHLDAEGVDTHFVTQAEGRETGVALVFVDDRGAKMIMTSLG